MSDDGFLLDMPLAHAAEHLADEAEDADLITLINDPATVKVLLAELERVGASEEWIAHLADVWEASR